MNLLQQLVNMVHGPQGHQQAPQRTQQPQQGYTSAQMAQMTPVGQPIPQGMMDSFSPETKQLAQIYQSNPMDSRVAHLDPAMFGYAPDNTAPRQPQGFSLQSVANMMPPQSQLQGRDNPGLIPLQGSRGFGTNPQMQAYNNPQIHVANPQNPYQMY